MLKLKQWNGTTWVDQHPIAYIEDTVDSAGNNIIQNSKLHHSLMPDSVQGGLKHAGSIVDTDVTAIQTVSQGRMKKTTIFELMTGVSLEDIIVNDTKLDLTLLHEHISKYKIWNATNADKFIAFTPETLEVSDWVVNGVGEVVNTSLLNVTVDIHINAPLIGYIGTQEAGIPVGSFLLFDKIDFDRTGKTCDIYFSVLGSRDTRVATDFVYGQVAVADNSSAGSTALANLETGSPGQSQLDDRTYIIQKDDSTVPLLAVNVPWTSEIFIHKFWESTNFTYKGIWSGGKSYDINDVVTHPANDEKDQVFLKAKQAVPVNTYYGHPDYWASASVDFLSTLKSGDHVTTTASGNDDLITAFNDDGKGSVNSFDTVTIEGDGTTISVTNPSSGNIVITKLDPVPCTTILAKTDALGGIELGSNALNVLDDAPEWSAGAYGDIPLGALRKATIEQGVYRCISLGSLTSGPHIYSPDDIQGQSYWEVVDPLRVYPIKLSSNKAYAEVPWTNENDNTNTTYINGDSANDLVLSGTTFSLAKPIYRVDYDSSGNLDNSDGFGTALPTTGVTAGAMAFEWHE